MDAWFEKKEISEVVTSTMINDLLLMLKFKAVESGTLEDGHDGSVSFKTEQSIGDEPMRLLKIQYYASEAVPSNVRVIWDVVVRDLTRHIDDLYEGSALKRYRVVENQGRYKVFLPVHDPNDPTKKVWGEVRDNSYRMGLLARDLYMEDDAEKLH